MKNKIIYICAVLFLCGGGYFFWAYIYPAGLISKMPAISESEIYNSNVGFSFHYPKDMFVMNDTDATGGNFRIFIVPNSYKNDKSQPMTAVVISASLNDPPQTPLEWLNSPDSGADMSKGYSTLNIDGQEAVSMNDGDWITVNTPDDKRQISIATLPSENPSQSLQDEISSIVGSFVFVK